METINPQGDTFLPDAPGLLSEGSRRKRVSVHVKEADTVYLVKIEKRTALIEFRISEIEGAILLRTASTMVAQKYRSGAVRERVGDDVIRLFVSISEEHLSIIGVAENITLHPQTELVASSYFAGHLTLNGGCE